MDKPSFKDWFRASQVRAALGVDPLLAQLSDASALRRRQAATALGLSGSDKAVPALREALSDSDPGVAAAAAAALQNLGAREAAPELSRAARHPDVVVAVTAIGALAALRCPESVPAALERLRLEAALSPDATRRILAELHGVRSDALEAEARKLLEHPSADVRLEAALRVAECDHWDALPVLAHAYLHPGAAERDAALCGSAGLAPLARAVWGGLLPVPAAGAVYAAWRDSGGHVYFQGLG